MRFLANENIPQIAVTALIDLGHDIIWIRAMAPGSTDQEVLRLAQDENRVLITFDKDFGELAIKENLPASSGIILLRISTHSPESIASVIQAAFQTRNDWPGHFSVVEDERIRMTPLR
jgi:predicted nuclease of predicted toxin-antitoxin system